MDPRPKPRKHHTPNCFWRARRWAQVKQAEASEHLPCDDYTLFKYEHNADPTRVPWAVWVRLAALYQQRCDGAGLWLLRQHPAVQEAMRLGIVVERDPRPAA